jgi:arylsulfatase A-like enzyme
MSARVPASEYLVILVTLLLLSPVATAGAACVAASEARAVGKSIRLAVRCNDKILRRGPGTICRQSPPPACADTLVTDAVALGYGPNNPPASAADRKALREHLRCQKRVGKGVSSYVAKALQLLVRGVPPDEAGTRARRQLDRIADKCAVTVAEDASGVILPAVGAQCFAAVGDPGSLVDGGTLADCLRTLLQVWVARVGPNPQPLMPNMVFILTDDQRWDTTDAQHSPFGSDVMSGVRRELAGAGVEFPNAFMTTPICCPSRASILAGQYAHNTGIHSNKPPNGGAEEFDDSSTLGTWLQAAGYRTGFYGKYMNGYHNLWDPTQGELPYVPPGWSEWHVFERPRFFDYTLIRNGVPEDYGSEDADYSTDVLRNLAIEFVESSTALGQPFFLYLNTKAPHLPKTPAPRHDGVFDGILPWRPESYNEADVSDKPTWLQNVPPLDAAEQAALDLVRQKQLEMLLAVDEAIAGSVEFQIRGLIDALRDTGVLDDTIIIYFSDNGWMWGEHRLTKKNCPYEECIRSPMFVRYHRLVPLPRKDSRFAVNIDLGPTLAALGGATIPTPVDGQSLERVLDGTAPAWRSDLLVEGYRAGRVFAQVREAEWKYIETIKDETTFELELELYDLVSDPLELQSLHDDPASADRIAAMAARLRELRPGWPEDGIGAATDDDE